jgi:DNA-directed RNA polymerase III subunit RPC1
MKIATIHAEILLIVYLYSDDGLDPQLMETGDRPVDYIRQTTNITTANPFLNESPLSSTNLTALVANRLSTDSFQCLLPQGTQFLIETAEFFEKYSKEIRKFETSTDSTITASRIQELRQLKVVDKAGHAAWIDKTKDTSSREYTELNALLCDSTCRLTASQVNLILDKALLKYNMSMIQPGEAIGAVGSQSLSEPTTQMTLKTFHFAGVASMNVSQILHILDRAV